MTLTRLRQSDFETIQPPLPQFTFSILLAGRSRPWRDLGDGFAVPKGAEAFRHQGGGILTPQNTPAVWRVEGTHDCLIFSLPRQIVERTLEDVLPSGLSALDRLTDRVVNAPVFAAVSLALWQQPEDEIGRIYGDHGVALVLARLAREVQAGSPQDEGQNAKENLAPRHLKRAMEYMRGHIADDPSLDDIASAAGLSPFHFLRAFKATTGRTPFQWLQDFRIEMATGLLAATDVPLAELALQVGFKNQSHFTVAFRRATGTTPARWRAEARG